jgi:hypothetical protein
VLKSTPKSTGNLVHGLAVLTPVSKETNTKPA